MDVSFKRWIDWETLMRAFDFDDDGRSEVMVSGAWVYSHPTYSVLCHISAALSKFGPDRVAFIKAVEWLDEDEAKTYR